MTDVTATRLHREGGDLTKKARAYRLTIRHGDGTSESVEVAILRARLGSRDDNEVVLRDPAVSRLHAEITLDEHGFRLRDLESRNGSYVDGMRVRDVYLRPGSLVRLAATELRFEPLGVERDVALSRTGRFGELVGESLAMRELFARLERAAASDATILVTGESGTGKELVARAIHDASPRAKSAFVVFDCASVAASLLESELFGHERGAFTGASTRREGAVAEADGGTLFLDEIGELPLELQPKLLRLLERRELRRVGSSHWEPVDVRVVAATHRDLARAVNRGTFREDLYYRLAVVEAHVPALRERRDDIPLLVRTLIERGVRGDVARARRVLDGLSRESWSRLEAHPFPGNVRELRNVVERLLVLGELPAGKTAAAREAPRETSDAPDRSTSPASLAHLVDPSRPWMEQKRQLVGTLEDAYLHAVLERHGGNISQAAAAAGVERMYFKRLLKKYEGPGEG